MFKHILVTLDGTPGAEAVLPHAIDIARSMKADLTLMRCVEAVNAEWSERGAMGKGHSEATIRSVFADQAQSYLDRVGTQVREAGITAQTLVKQGAPAKQIVAAAKEVDADAIAMSTHSRRGINRLMFGSVAEAVLHGSSLPVLLIRSAGA